LNSFGFVAQSYAYFLELPKEKREKFVTYAKFVYLCTQLTEQLTKPNGKKDQ
jgi:hypothetical protein